MKKPIATVICVGVFAAATSAGAASERVVGTNDRVSANEALDQAEENAPAAADYGLSTARDAVNNNGVGQDGDAVSSRARSHAGSAGTGGRSGHGDGAGSSGSRGGPGGGRP